MQHLWQAEIFLFGGEYFDGKADKQYTYADLYKYHTVKNQWTRLIIPQGYLKLHSTALPDVHAYASHVPTLCMCASHSCLRYEDVIYAIHYLRGNAALQGCH